jgi:hypothetical protein
MIRCRLGFEYDLELTAKPSSWIASNTSCRSRAHHIRSHDGYINLKSLRMSCSRTVKVFKMPVATKGAKLHNVVDVCPDGVVTVLLVLNLVGNPGTNVSTPQILEIIVRNLDRRR